MDAQQFDDAIKLALDAFVLGHKNFMRATVIAQTAIPDYCRSRWLLTCTASLFHVPEAALALHSIRENLPLLPSDAI